MLILIIAIDAYALIGVLFSTLAWTHVDKEEWDKFVDDLCHIESAINVAMLMCLLRATLLWPFIICENIKNMIIERKAEQLKKD